MKAVIDRAKVVLGFAVGQLMSGLASPGFWPVMDID